MNHLPRLLIRASAFFILLTFVGTPMLTPASATGMTYYVNSATGSDSNPGSLMLPWKTIQKAAKTLTAGQTVQVAAGTYPERVRISRSGARGAMIVFQANGTVVMRGFTVHASYVNISGFEITDPTLDRTRGWGVYLAGTYDIVEKNYIHDMTWGGILLFATISNPTQTAYVTVQNNKIYHVGQLGIDVRGRHNTVSFNDISAIMQNVPWNPTPPSWSDADGIHFHGRGHIIQGNNIHDILYSQVENPSPHIDCFQTFVASPSQEAARNIVFDRNICNEPTRNTTLGLAAKLIQAAHARRLQFTNNIAYTYLGGIIKNGSKVSLLNNTFVVPADATDGQGLQFKNVSYVTVENNIFSNQSDGIGAIHADSKSKSTLVSGFDCLWKQGNRIRYPGDVVGQDPLFVNGAGDFHLQTGSPCIDRGTTVVDTHDMDNHPRPQNLGYDMGAYER